MTTKYVMDRRLQLSFCDMAIVFHRLNSSYSKLSLISRIFKFFILINYFYDWSQLSGVFLFITLILLAMKDFQKCILGSLTFSHYREIFSRLCAASGCTILHNKSAVNHDSNSHGSLVSLKWESKTPWTSAAGAAAADVKYFGGPNRGHVVKRIKNKTHVHS